MRLRKQIEALDEALDDLRDVVQANEPKKVEIPFAMIEDNDPETMDMRQGEWVDIPHWPGMRCMLTKIEASTESRYILCETTRDVDMGAHKHEGFVEEVYMMEGQLRDKIHGITMQAGSFQKYPAGEPHWPVTDGPAFFMVVFRRIG